MEPPLPQRIMKINGSRESEKTNPKQSQTNPISEKPKMNLNFYSTKAYDNKPRLRAPGKQTEFKPKQTQFPLPQTPHPSQFLTPRNTQSCPERSRRDAIRHPTYEIRYTQCEIRYTEYDIRNTKSKPNPPPQSRPPADSSFIIFLSANKTFAKLRS